MQKAEFEPVFYPPPPSTPRLQFLTSFAGGKDFHVEKASFLETFVLGDSEAPVDSVVKPYGVALHKGKIYVCDVGQGNIKIMDLVNNTFATFPSGRSLQRPANIFIESDGTKYVADVGSGVVSVWNAEDKLAAFLGRDLGMRPIDVVVHGGSLYITDANSNQVLILDKHSGQLLGRIGKGVGDGQRPGAEELAMITDLAVDHNGDVYVGDKLKGSVTRFGPGGSFVRSYGQGGGSSPASLVRSKGIAVDREGRVWVADAGPSCAVKVFREDGQLLMYFGTLGTLPGQMYLPADVTLDYDNVKLFEKYAVKGAKLDFLVLVTNQFGNQKVSVYGFGTFPELFAPSGSSASDISERSEQARPQEPVRSESPK
ncbi:MAG: hypothetical protein IH624_01060 [Phycisphaerae bacterium]|nr:hypothetical protein [Phycisphaerae bacterium]